MSTLVVLVKQSLHMSVQAWCDDLGHQGIHTDVLSQYLRKASRRSGLDIILASTMWVTGIMAAVLIAAPRATQGWPRRTATELGTTTTAARQSNWGGVTSATHLYH